MKKLPFLSKVHGISKGKGLEFAAERPRKKENLSIPRPGLGTTLTQTQKGSVRTKDLQPYLLHNSS